MLTACGWDRRKGESYVWSWGGAWTVPVSSTKICMLFVDTVRDDPLSDMWCYLWPLNCQVPKLKGSCLSREQSNKVACLLLCVPSGAGLRTWKWRGVWRNIWAQLDPPCNIIVVIRASQQGCSNCLSALYKLPGNFFFGPQAKQNEVAQAVLQLHLNIGYNKLRDHVISLCSKLTEDACFQDTRRLYTRCYAWCACRL